MPGMSKLFLGSAYYVNKEYEKAVRSFQECLKCRVNIPKNADDAHISAFAQYELGALLMKNEDVNLLVYSFYLFKYIYFLDEARRTIITATNGTIPSIRF